MKKTINIGEKYGRFTVIGEEPHNRFGARCFRCRCVCGYEADYSASVITGKPNRYCRKCVPHTGGYKRPDIVGKTINGWKILDNNDDHPGNAYFFTCQCVRCGNISIRSTAQITASKSNRCERCPPMYGFDIKNGIAVGHLPDGTSFIIDEDDIGKVERHFWRSGKENYVVESNSPMRLHRYIMGVTDPKIMVDHINRDRRDCRKENLRIISTFGNSCNHNLFETNKTGYSGVYYSKCSSRYEVKIGYNRKRILLGTTKAIDQLPTLAQMYNIAASFLFGDYVGALNDVPDPPDELVLRIIAKCKKYMKTPASPGVFVA